MSFPVNTGCPCCDGTTGICCPCGNCCFDAASIVSILNNPDVTYTGTDADMIAIVNAYNAHADFGGLESVWLPDCSDLTTNATWSSGSFTEGAFTYLVEAYHDCGGNYWYGYITVQNANAYFTISWQATENSCCSGWSIDSAIYDYYYPNYDYDPTVVSTTMEVNLTNNKCCKVCDTCTCHTVDMCDGVNVCQDCADCTTGGTLATLSGPTDCYDHVDITLNAGKYCWKYVEGYNYGGGATSGYRTGLKLSKSGETDIYIGQGGGYATLESAQSNIIDNGCITIPTTGTWRLEYVQNVLDYCGNFNAGLSTQMKYRFCEVANLCEEI